jgi:RHH-type proline utilization regulon transcriptional repressor/proline dehydrogenase/delta 1-pyrroline-5-carboxylate dehydrogenase
MLLGAMAELQVGNPAVLAADMGPVIDARAQTTIQRHINTMRAQGHAVHQAGRVLSTSTGAPYNPLEQGAFVWPTVVEIDHVSQLGAEVFGPVLHLLRYQRQDLPDLLQQINATGYGLTMGVHTRIDETVDLVQQNTHAGNLYVNRNMVGAVVGVQPFGGEGLSGTGPKAGGPLYLYRLLAHKPPIAWVPTMAINRESTVLTGPTGERNTYHLVPRKRVLCLANRPSDRLAQLAAVRAVGGEAIVSTVQDWTQTGAFFDAVLLHGSPDELAQVQRHLAGRPGPVVAVERLEPGDTAIPLERLVVERAVSVNTAAAGGNASLMTLV